MTLIKIKMNITLLILIFTLIYIKFGLLVLISIIIWLLVFFVSNFLIQFNPTREMYIIRILSIIVIIFILYYNSIEHLISTSLIIPLSVSKISFLDEFIGDDDNPSSIFYIKNSYVTWFLIFVISKMFKIS